ncbi:phytanoyl-CoA dioxygenase family protein [Ekhidna sp.]
MDFRALANQFWNDGYIYVKGFFPKEMMKKFNGMCLEHFGLNPEWEHTSEFIEKSNCEIVPWFPLREGVDEFLEIDQDSGLNMLTELILGEGWKNLYCMTMFSKKGTSGQAWHQDSPPDDLSKFNLNRLIYTHSISDKTGGQVVVVPGSHKRGMITVGDPNENIANQVVLNPNQGDIVILHGHCWHRVLPVTGAYRVSTNFRAIPKGTSTEITDTAIYRNMKYYFPTNEVLEERV